MRSPRQLTESRWNLVRAMVRRRVCAMGGVHELFFFESRGSRGELGAPGAPGGRNRREPRRRPSSTYPVRAPSLSTRPTRRSTSICSTSRTRSTRSSGPAAPDSRQNGASLPPARRRVADHAGLLQQALKDVALKDVIVSRATATPEAGVP